MRVRGWMAALIVFVGAAFFCTSAIAADGVRVWDSAARPPRPCPEVQMITGLPGGSCVVRAVASMDLKVATAIAQFPFATCSIEYNVRIDRTGRTLVSELEFDGKSPCPDIRPCFPDPVYVLSESLGPPWKGRIVKTGEGRYEHRVDACVDSCLGRFEGKLVLRLERQGVGWRALTQRGGPVGLSGLSLGTGSWRWKGLRAGLGQPPTLDAGIDLR